MDGNTQRYLAKLKEQVCEKISLDICSSKLDKIVKKDLVERHLKTKRSVQFQRYYFSILRNENLFCSPSNFFRRFKVNYSLQGIDNEFLDKLEFCKAEILSDIHANDLIKLYFDKFNKVPIKRGNTQKPKNLGSFFAKLVHTFRPSEFCALDNPIKNYFGLKSESFVVAFLVISDAYKTWAMNNRTLLRKIRAQLKAADKEQVIEYKELTDLKLLDMIFWTKANPPAKAG